MLLKSQVQRYSAESRLRDIMIAEKEIILTYLLQLLKERGVLDRFAFKGGTCIRKMYIGTQGRFSTDLDFTALEEHDHETVILDMMDAFAKPFHSVQFSIPDNTFYDTQDGLSWGVNPIYMHSWNSSGGSEIKIQISRREIPNTGNRKTVAMRTELFQASSFCPLSNQLPCTIRNHCRENTCLLPTQ